MPAYLADSLKRVLLTLVLLLGVFPARAAQAVCVFGDQRVVAMGTCGMPCCRGRVVEAEGCCVRAAKDRLSAPAGAACRCETRTVFTSASPVTEKSVPAIQVAAAIFSPHFRLGAVGTVASEETPPRTEHAPSYSFSLGGARQSRAPPAASCFGIPSAPRRSPTERTDRTMINQAFLSLTLALVAPAQTPNLPACCETVTQVVYEHPKPAYPKDARQYTYVKKTVEKVVCKTSSDAGCCAAISRRGE